MQLVQILKTFQTADYSEFYSIKDAGKFKATYISWFDLCTILDNATDGLWEWKLIATREGDRVVVIGELTIIDDSGNRLTKSATGNENDVVMSYGDPVSNSEAMAFRRAAAKFGIGRELWGKEKPANRSARPASQSQVVKNTPGTISKDEWLRLQREKQEMAFQSADRQANLDELRQPHF
jgi:hypothetical protein